MTLKGIGGMVFQGGSQPYINRTAGRLVACTLEDLNNLTPSQFEYVSAEVLRSKDYCVEEVGGDADGGIDLIVTNAHGVVSGVQCKRWKHGLVRIENIREFVGALVGMPKAKSGLYITTAKFTDDARTQAAVHDLELIDGARLLGMISPTVAERVLTILRANASLGVPLCQFCGAPMVRRMAKKGKDVGQEFWGCSNFGRTKCWGKRKI